MSTYQETDKIIIPKKIHDMILTEFALITVFSKKYDNNNIQQGEELDMQMEINNGIEIWDLNFIKNRYIDDNAPISVSINRPFFKNDYVEKFSLACWDRKKWLIASSTDDFIKIWDMNEIQMLFKKPKADLTLSLNDSEAFNLNCDYHDNYFYSDFPENPLIPSNSAYIDKQTTHYKRYLKYMFNSEDNFIKSVEFINYELFQQLVADSETMKLKKRYFTE